MFIRWKERHGKKYITLYAQLYQAYRDENGQPKQKVVMYVASIRDKAINVVTRNIFWYEANMKLEEANLSEDELKQAIEKLSSVVKPLDEDEYIEYQSIVRSLWRNPVGLTLTKVEPTKRRSTQKQNKSISPNFHH